MYGFSRRLCQIRRQLHTVSYHEGPSETMKRKIAELERLRKTKKSPKKDQFIVEVPESKSYLDTASLPLMRTVVGVALFTKLLMMVPISHFPFFLSILVLILMGIFVFLEKKVIFEC